MLLQENHRPEHAMAGDVYLAFIPARYHAGMTIIRFPRRLTDELRLTIQAARAEGDMPVAERLQRVLHKYAGCTPRLPITQDHRRFPGMAAASDAAGLAITRLPLCNDTASNV